MGKGSDDGHQVAPSVTSLVVTRLACCKSPKDLHKRQISQTDCEDVVLPFNPLGEKRRADFGIEYLLNQFAPCALLKFIKFTQDIIYGSPPLLNQHNVSVTFHDARKKSPGKQRYGELILTG